MAIPLRYHPNSCVFLSGKNPVIYWRNYNCTACLCVHPTRTNFTVRKVIVKWKLQPICFVSFPWPTAKMCSFVSNINGGSNQLSRIAHILFTLMRSTHPLHNFRWLMVDTPYRRWISECLTPSDHRQRTTARYSSMVQSLSVVSPNSYLIALATRLNYRILRTASYQSPDAHACCDTSELCCFYLVISESRTGFLSFPYVLCLGNAKVLIESSKKAYD